MDGQAISELSETGNKIVGDTLLILLNAQFQNVPFKLPTHQSGRPWQLLLSSDRALKHRISALYAAAEDFMLKDHSMAIFQLHVHVQRIARRMSRTVLSSPMRKPTIGEGSFDSPDSLHLRIPGAEGSMSSPRIVGTDGNLSSPDVSQRLPVPKKYATDFWQGEVDLTVNY